MTIDILYKLTKDPRPITTENNDGGCSISRSNGWGTIDSKYKIHNKSILRIHTKSLSYWNFAAKPMGNKNTS
jgi:hypothetical protein